MCPSVKKVQSFVFYNSTIDKIETNEKYVYFLCFQIGLKTLDELLQQLCKS